MKRTKKTLVLLLMLVVSAMLLTGCKSKSVRAMEKAESEMDSGNYLNAIENLNQVIKACDESDPEDVLQMINACYLRGDCHAKRGELEEAQADYELALSEDTKERGMTIEQTATRCLRRALVLISKENWSEAVAALQQGLACDEVSCDRELRRNLVICLERTGSWEEAKTEAEAYVQSYPDDEEMVKERDFLATR